MSNQRAKAHAKHSHECFCGRVVWGNGGWASHRRACRTYNLRYAQVLRDLIEYYEGRSVWGETLSARRRELAEIEARIAEKGWADDG